MIRIGIIGAMKKELCILRKMCSINKKNNQFIFNTYFGTAYNVSILIAESGIGKVLSALSAMHIIQSFNPHLIINVGISGSLKKNVDIGSIILSKKFCYHDVNVSAFGYQCGQVPGSPQYYYASKFFIRLIKKILNFNKSKFKFGLIVSGDTFIYDKNILDAVKIKKLFPSACAVDMETAAIAQVCQKFLVPYISVRSISDYVFNHAEKNFKKFCSFAIYQYSLTVFKIIKEIDIYYAQYKNLIK